MQPDQQPRQNGTERDRRMPRRPTDRVEDALAWLLCLVLMVAAVVAVFVGVHAHADVLEMARAQAAERTQVTGTLTRDTPRARDGDATTNAPVRWTGKDGVERVDNAEVRTGLAQGDAVHIWVDRSYHVVPPPAGPADALVAGVLGGGMLLAAVAAALAMIWRGTRWLTMARNCAHWEREWARIEPTWRQRYR